jgi:hypothetical protein
VVKGDHLKVGHLTGQLEARNGVGEIGKTHYAVRVSTRTKGECVTVTVDGVLEYCI